MESSMEFFSTRLGDLVSDERQKTGKSQNVIAGEIGISSGALSQYISEKREPGAIALIKIAKYFNVSPNDLLFADGEKWNDDISDEELLCAKIHSYTGLSKDAVKILHKEKERPFFMPVVNSLILENSDGGEYLLDDVVEYMISDLWNDLEYDRRYNILPGSADWHATERGITTTEYKRKEILFQIGESLPKAREWFYSSVLTSDNKTKKDSVKKLAMSAIKNRAVVEILYDDAQIERLEQEKRDLDEQSMEEFERELRDKFISTYPELSDYQGVLPIVGDNLLDYDEFIAAQNEYPMPVMDQVEWRGRALSYLKEYIEYRRKNTAK